MTDLRQLREIEKLVEDSVFHPSPRHHLRERVLEHAVKAKHRQKLWQRFAVASSAVMGLLLVAFAAVHHSAPRPTAATEAGPVRVQIYSPGHNPRLPAGPHAATTERASLGEDLYLRPAALQEHGSPQASEPPAGAAQARLSNDK